MKALEASTTTISVLTRHAADCPKTDPQWRRCNCRKSLYIYEHGKVTYKSAKTRSWEQAEKVAQAERDARDPVKLELARIAAEQAARRASKITVEDALTRWLASHKKQKESSIKVYRILTDKVKAWAKREGFVYLSDVTPNALDKWRSQWSPKAVVKGDRMSQTTQSHFLSRIKGFFSYCANLDLIDRDPAKSLEYIPMKSKKTMPLTPEQFKHVLKVTAKTSHGKELVALFLLMRWSGLRINDALSLRKTDMCGNRLIMTTQKTTADMNRPLPDEVIKALKSLPSEGVRPGYYFWPTGSTKASLTSVWTKYILHLNDELALKDEHGKPMKFHSHCLRDTFAVELLLAGVSLEKVSQLLTHKSVRTTEAYYAPWVSARRVQLENEMKEAMRKMGASFAGD